jgi:hypothetical protein
LQGPGADPIGAMINTIEAPPTPRRDRSVPAPRPAMTGRALTTIKRPAEPWRQRLIRSPLYGRNVDRAAKARGPGRLGHPAVRAIYAVLAGRLVMFAVGADSHGAPHRLAGRDCDRAARYRRPQRRGARHRRQAPSLFGEPSASSTRTRRSNS